MSKDQIRDAILSLYGFSVSSTVFIWNHVSDREMWITFATAAGGVLSIAKAIQIFWEMRRDKKEAEMKESVAKFAENVAHIFQEEDMPRPKNDQRRDKHP